MVTTTTPNPDDEAALRHAYRGGQTYPPAPDDRVRLSITTDQLARECAAHPGQVIIAVIHIGAQPEDDKLSLEFADGHRIDLLTA